MKHVQLKHWFCVNKSTICSYRILFTGWPKK